MTPIVLIIIPLAWGVNLVAILIFNIFFAVNFYRNFLTVVGENSLIVLGGNAF